MPQERASKKSKGKRQASSSPEMIDLPPAQHVAPQITLRRSRAVRTIVAFPDLEDIAKGFGPYLNPHLGFDLDQGLLNRLIALILTARPRLQTALSHIDTCQNVDLNSLATHVSFLFWRLRREDFQAYFGTEGWHWLRDEVPLEAFAGMQTSGDPEQMPPPTLPKVIIPGATGEEDESSEDEEPAPKEQSASQHLETAVNPESEDAPVPASSLEMELFPPGEEDEGQEPAALERTTSVALPLPLAATRPARPMVATNRPTTVISLPHLQPPPGRRPRVAPVRKKAQKHEAFPHVEPPGVLPVYEMGPLFLQSSALRELTLPLNAGPVPSWCASLKQTCGFDTRIPRFASSQQLVFAGEAEDGGNKREYHAVAIASGLCTQVRV
ncbi:hypothetical protein H1R20_g2135, partial [Candolleomyces eurysporus]